MKLSQFLTLHAILALALGIAFALYGPLMIAAFGVPEIPENNVLLYWNVASFARLFGGALFGSGLLLWSIRRLPDEKGFPAAVRRGIVFAMLLSSALVAFVAITQQVSVWGSPAGWVTFGLFTALTLVYGYFLVTGAENPEISNA